MYPTQLTVQGEHIVLDLLRYGHGFRIVVAIDIHLDGCRNGLVVHLAETHMGLFKIVGVFVVPFFQQGFGGLL